VDLGFLYSLRGKLHKTAAAAVLAAVGDFPDEDAARGTAVDLATKNMPAAGHGTVLANADVVVGDWDAGTRAFTPAGSPMNSVRVVTRRFQANGNAAGLFFARVLGFDQVDMQATAIASSQGGGDSCIIALDPSANDALRIAGTASVTMSCAARVNSPDNRAARTNGGGCITASEIYVAGDTIGTCIDPTAETGMKTMDDPLEYLTPPDDYEDDGCTFPALVEVTTDTTLDPGVYCGGIHIYGSANVTFNPGNYVVDGGGLEIYGSGAVAGDEVTFYIEPAAVIPFHHHQGPGKTVHFAGSANITLSAPDSGAYKDGPIYRDPATPSDRDLVFNGGADMEFNGVLYFPNNLVRFAGNGGPGGATSIVARTVYFTGNANFGSNPATKLFGPGGANGISLVQ